MTVSTARKPRLTLVEQEKILIETIGLIREPASWTVGSWKCALYETDKQGKQILDENGVWKRACDHNNRPLSQYCVEGALNQATYNILGKERAIKLGAYREGYDDVEEYGESEAFSSECTKNNPAELLGINKLAMELYRDQVLEATGFHEDDYDGEDAAMYLNDSFEESHDPEGHKVILNLLNTRLTEVRDELDAREVS